MVLQPNESLNLKHSLQRLTIPESVSNFKPPLSLLLSSRLDTVRHVRSEILLRPLSLSLFTKQQPPVYVFVPRACVCVYQYRHQL